VRSCPATGCSRLPLAQDSLVDTNWAEIADHIETIEELYEVSLRRRHVSARGSLACDAASLVPCRGLKRGVVRQDDKFENRELAAIIASKVHYHLEQFDESLTYALGAGRLFTDQITAGKPSQYVFTILSKVSFASGLRAGALLWGGEVAQRSGLLHG
jgi:hypothetical protein